MDENELQDLQNRLALATIDLRQRIERVLSVQIRRLDGPPVLEVLVKEHDALVLRIDANRNHGRPHLHIDLGKDYHAASYAINNGERLAGKSTKYDREIGEWIANNQLLLMQVWDAVRGGWSPKAVEKQLKDSPFP